MTTDDLAYTHNRFVIATVSDVWNYWTSQTHLLHWFGPSGIRILEVTTDLRINGKWTARMQSPDGTTYLTHGLYLDIQEPSKLVMTQQWEGSNHSSEITVHLLACGKGTDIVFVQRYLESVHSRETHAEGWDEALDNLERYVNTQI